MPLDGSTLRETSDRLRHIPLADVAAACGLAFYKHDRQFKDPNRRLGISVTGDGRFFDHKAQTGGFGAIDFAMHVTGNSFTEARQFLSDKFGTDASSYPTVEPVARGAEPHDKPPIHVEHVASKWPAVKRYLTVERGLHPAIVQRFHERGQLIADRYGNAVMVGFDEDGVQRIAEKRSTSGPAMKLLEKGSNKDYAFSLLLGTTAKTIIFFEGGIDLQSWTDISWRDKTLPTDTLLVSTAGIRSTVPRSLVATVAAAERVLISFDDDPPRKRDGARVHPGETVDPADLVLGPGNQAAADLAKAIGEHKCTRLKPPDDGCKDWNEHLQRLSRQSRSAQSPGVQSRMVR